MLVASLVNNVTVGNQASAVAHDRDGATWQIVNIVGTVGQADTLPCERWRQVVGAGRRSRDRATVSR